MDVHEMGQEHKSLPRVVRVALPVGALALVAVVAFGGEPLMHAVGQILPIVPHFQALPGTLHNPDVGMIHEVVDVVTEL